MNDAADRAEVESASADEFGAQLEIWRVRMEHALAARLPDQSLVPARLHEAMRYSVLGGGKRIRPALLFATARALGLSEDEVEAAACAIELVHVYSLVHDDLPAMDDDDLRRIYAFLTRIASRTPDFFKIPHEGLTEVGFRVEI